MLVVILWEYIVEYFKYQLLKLENVTKEKIKKKDGFPLKACGNDTGGF